MKPILFLVDLQLDYLNDSRTQPHPDSIIHAAKITLDKCRSLSIPVVHVRTTVSKDNDRRMAHWKHNQLWKCVEGSPGHKPPAALVEQEDEIVINKTGFDPLEDEQLRSILSEEKFDTALVCGIHLHACVREVIMAVYSAGLKVMVVNDAVGSNDPLHAATTRRYLEERTIRFVNTSQLNNLNTIPFESASDQVNDHISMVHEAFDIWRKQDADARVDNIKKFAKILLKEKQALAKKITSEIGKPIFYAIAEIDRTAEMIADIINVYRSIDLVEEFKAYQVRHVPLGVIAMITPWNNPVYIALGKIIPAILYGNTVIWKPSPKAINISIHLAKLLKESGLPEGVVQLSPGDNMVAIKILNHSLVNGATFTGSIQTGDSIQELCARRHIPLQAELGGNNAAIVWSDADIQYAARQICNGAFEMAGQRCTANRRVIVHRECADQLLMEMKTVMKSMAQGDPKEMETRIGPVIDFNQKLVVQNAIERSRQAGMNVYQSESESFPESGNYVIPTLITCDNSSSEIFQEETFGPILVCHIVDNWNEAISACNQVKQGLVAAIFTQSKTIEERFLDEAEAGILKINRTTSDAEVGAPFGGWKASGIGPAEHGQSDMEFYTRLQTVYRKPE